MIRFVSVLATAIFHTHTPTHTQHIGNVEVGGSGLLMEELEKLRVVMEMGLEGLSQRMDQCERGMSSLTNRVTALEKL